MMLQSIECDLLVIGSGAAGLSAAVSAAFAGQRVVVIEAADAIGGATAWSGGWMWLPFNPLAKRAGIVEDPRDVRTYLRHELGDKYKPEMVEMFLEKAPEMVAFFEQHTDLQFAEGHGIPDIHGDSPGAAKGGHQLIAAPFDSRPMGRRRELVRKPMAETSFFAMPIQAGADLGAFLNVFRSPANFWHVAKRLLRHALDLCCYGRATHLVNGLSLVARLLASADKLGVDTRINCKAIEILREQGCVVGAVVEELAGRRKILAKNGVVLATGGFSRDVERRQQLFPRNPGVDEHFPLPPASCDGSGLRLAEQVGARVDTSVASPAAWAPVSRVPLTRGRVGTFPHIIDRAKPGVIAVLANGQRFVNEADGYYDYVAAMIDGTPEGEEVSSWLICDYRSLRRYGLGFVRPAPVPFGHWIKRGYLKHGVSLQALAEACQIDAAALEQSVARSNADALQGADHVFGKGTTPYNQKMGDSYNKPNPCIGPCEQAPFYAIKIVPGSFGTFAGLCVDQHARALDSDNQPIPGLFAAGSDMASLMGGYYPSGGINLGPAMVFGYVAAVASLAAQAGVDNGQGDKQRDEK